MYKFTATLETDNIENLKKVARSQGWQEQIEGEVIDEDGNISYQIIDNPIPADKFIEENFPQWLASTYLRPAVDESIQQAIQATQQQAEQQANEYLLSKITCTVTEE